MTRIASQDKGIVTFRSYPSAPITLNEVFDNDFIRRFFLPYCFITLDKHANKTRYWNEYQYAYLPLNRNYKPLGIVNRVWVNYDDYPQNMIYSKKPFFEISGVFTKEDKLTKHTTFFYMYNDGLESRADYFSRLKYLMKYVDERD